MNWKYCVIRKMNPNSEKNATVTEPLAALKRGLRNRPTSSIGARRAPLPGDEPGEQAEREREAAERRARSPSRGPGASMIV